MKQQNTTTFASECHSIFDQAKNTLTKGEKRVQELVSEMAAEEKAHATKMESLRKEHANVLSTNERLKSMISAAHGNSSSSEAPKSNGKGKPGPKKGTKRAAKASPKAAPAPAKKAAKKAAKKPGPKPKKAAAAPDNTSNAAEGRRAVARGDRPPMKEAMAIVMGKSKMGAADVVEGLKKRSWMPNAQDPQQYVSYMLSSNKDVFERIERGQYKVRDGVSFAKKPKAKAGAGDTAPAKKGPKASASSKKTTDEELEDLGIKTGGSNVASNPFAGD